MLRRLTCIFLLICCACLATAQADELRPVYIQLDQQNEQTWQLLWQASAKSSLGRNGNVVLPENCKSLAELQVRIKGDTIRRSGELNCDGTLFEQRIGLAGLELSQTDALVRIAPTDSELITLRLTADKPSALITNPAPGVISNVALTYTVIGVEHIVWGFDHFLFVLALVLLLTGWKRIAWAVTAFTVSHSLTLVGTTLGVFALPQKPVEAVIALSIVFLAAEIIKAQPDRPRLSERYPWLVAFLFGLLHGFGFAGALAEIGLPENDRPLALLSFNVGVEVGQLFIVAIAMLVLAVLGRLMPRGVRAVKFMCAYAIGILATYWFIERLVLA